jgi:nucleoside-diphosphate-sugar epimerase
MPDPRKNVFLLGPGYIGREVIDCLLESSYHVTALVRRETAGKELEKDGISFVLGSLEDSDIITQQTAASDIVIHTATADDVDSLSMP